jgi:tetratricopeptide (TPR) repeat protein
MKTLPGLFAIVATCFPLKGWSTVPDSLKCRIDSLSELARSAEVNERYLGEFGIAWELYDIDNPVAARYAGKAYKSICEIADSARMLRTGRLFGQLLRRVDKLDSSSLILEGVLPVAVALKDSIEQAKIHNALSVVYTYQGRYDVTLINNLKALEIWRSLGDTAGAVRALENTGVTYYKMGNWSEAERYYQNALRFPRFYNSYPLLTNIALVKIMLGDTLAFREYNERALRETPLNVATTVCFNYSFSYGLHFMRLNKIDRANALFHEALNYAQQIDDFRLATETKFKIAECYARLGYHAASMKMLEGLENPLLSSSMDPLRLMYYHLLSEGFERRGQLKKALIYKRRYIALNDTVEGQMAMNKVLMARVKFDEERSNQALSQQAEVILLKEEVIARQELLIFMGTSLLMVLLVLGFVLIRFYRFQKQLSKDLDTRVLERTRELQLSERELISNLGQQHALMEMISGKVQASLATLRGIWMIRFSEHDYPRECEFEKAASELLQVSKIVGRSFGSPKTQFPPDSD